MGPEKIRNDKVDRKWQNNAYEKGICGRRVLIEPYWNVKYNAKFKGLRKNNRINRTILECKEEIITFENVSFMVLIEPYWNVKSH